jgi:hypothetical protein
MTTVYKDEFIDRYKAEGRTEGKSEGDRAATAVSLDEVFGP